MPLRKAVAPEKGSKVDGDVEDLGAPVVKGDEKKGRCCKENQEGYIYSCCC